MDCCNNNSDNGNKQDNKHKGHLSHMWMMVLCCGAPLMILMLLPAISSFVPGAGNVMSKIVPFLCPLMMLIMMPMMMRNHNKDRNRENNNSK